MMKRLRFRNRWELALLAMILVDAAAAQEGATPPQWIWRQTGKSLGETPPETCYLRKSFFVKEPSRLTIDVTADNEYTLYLDGREIAQGSAWQTTTRVSQPIAPGRHTLAARASNEAEGPAGFLLGGSILPLGQGVPIHTNRSWRTTTKVPPGLDWTKPGFDDSAWNHARELGPLGAGPWANIAYGNDSASRFRPAQGLKIETAAEPSLTGSVVAFTFDPSGAPCVSIERGPIAKLVDDDHDGHYDRRVIIENTVHNCQGLAFIAGKLWVVGQGPRDTGLHRLEDRDQDGIYEHAELIRGTQGGMGEHGPHAVALGPDGLLYMNIGNHAHLKPPIEANSPVNVAYEGELLPHYNDSRGHAAGIMAPGGEILQSPDSGASWSRVAAGFRNEYDFAFHSDGSLFSFDSDMEWDVGLPWYRPVRVVFCPTGAEFGWRNGTGKWPTYYADSLPAVLDVGRGSPTGVTFYQAHRLPQTYHDNFLICDWSQGRILAVALERHGASYQARSSELVTGQPLNCTDIEVGPDEAVYFTTGGRGTQGGLFRILPANDAEPHPAAATPRGALELPAPLSSFTQKRFAAIKAKDPAAWSQTLTSVARNSSGKETAADRLRALLALATAGPKPSDQLLLELASDHNPLVRGRALGLLGLRQGPPIAAALRKALEDSEPFVRRIACEGLMRQPAHAIPIPMLIPLMNDPDRFLRATARTACEHGRVAENRALLLAQPPSLALVQAMIAIVRATPIDPALQEDLLKRQYKLLAANPQEPMLTELLRAIELTWLLGPNKKPNPNQAAALARLLAAKFQTAADSPANREIARLLAFLDPPQAVPAVNLILEHQSKIADHAAQIHDAYCLRAMKNGWSPQSKQTLWGWYQKASDWEGGFSFQGYLDFMIQELVARMDPAERERTLETAEYAPFPARVLVRDLDLQANPRLVSVLERLYGRLGHGTSADDLRLAIVEKLGQAETIPAREALARVVTADPGRRDAIAHTVLRRPRQADTPILLLALDSPDNNLAREAIQALDQIQAKPTGPAPLAALLRASKRLGPTSTPQLNSIASRITGLAPPKPNPNHFETLLAAWEKVYHDLYPAAPPIASATITEHNYTLPELTRLVIDSGLLTRASSSRGREVVKRARCLDCHKFGAEGQGVGPDLTTVNSRFRPVEILESILDPSKVISDQYKPVLIATVDGKTYNGMPVASDAKNLVLLLSDGSKITLPTSEIEARQDSKISVMPQGLLKTLSPEEIADLLALFESAPRVAAPAPAPAGR